MILKVVHANGVVEAINIADMEGIIIDLQLPDVESSDDGFLAAIKALPSINAILTKSGLVHLFMEDGTYLNYIVPGDPAKRDDSINKMKSTEKHRFFPKG